MKPVALLGRRAACPTFYCRLTATPERTSRTNGGAQPAPLLFGAAPRRTLDAADKPFGRHHATECQRRGRRWQRPRQARSPNPEPHRPVCRSVFLCAVLSSAHTLRRKRVPRLVPVLLRSRRLNVH